MCNSAISGRHALIMQLIGCCMLSLEIDFSSHEAIDIRDLILQVIYEEDVYIPLVKDI